MEAIRISELKLKPNHTEKEMEQEIRKTLRLGSAPFTYEIMRQSIDARKKPMILYVYTVDVCVERPASIMKKNKNKHITLVEKKEYRFPYGRDNCWNQRFSPIIVGSGPAGLFCSLMLARAGLSPVLLERGEAVEQRVETVNHFWETGILNPNSNVQFGEGGAGTFSDGKLNTLVKDPKGTIRFVLKEFVHAGADPAIIYHQKPHIGTDVLVGIVKKIRNEIQSLGGEVHFNSCVTGIRKENEQYYLAVNGKEDCFTTDRLVLAIGHSARDTFEFLHKMQIPMIPKAFAVGFRMEHPQNWINDAMYGKDCPYEMEAAPYKVTHKCENGRGVYSFCMCPGGYVVNASSEEGRTAVNGMSYSNRGSENANSAIIVTVTPEDYHAEDALAGMRFQRKLEEKAYQAGNGKIPLQRFEDFTRNKKTEALGCIKPQQKGAYELSNLRSILPEHLNADIIEGIKSFGRTISGFDHPDVLMSGIESRTSSPLRIIRDETCQSEWKGLFPCGEGAGYAGGITSAAVDGVRVAEQICASLQQL